MGGDVSAFGITTDGANAIRQLMAENKRLKKQLDMWRRAYNMLSGHVECAKVLRWCYDCAQAHEAALRGEEKDDE